MNTRNQDNQCTPDCKHHLLWRLLWICMLLIHARPVATLFLADEGFSPLRALFLGLSSAFFVLKIVDVPWLRFRTDLRATVTWLLILGIMHLGALSRTMESANACSGNGVAVVLISCVTAITTVAICRPVLPSFIGRLPRKHPVLMLISDAVSEWCAKFRTLCLISRTVPRGPPQ